MRIVELIIENVKRVIAIDIIPSGALVVIGGKNGQGKSSTLDAIMYALAGKGSICKNPVHTGATAANITVDLGTIVVTRTFALDGTSTLVVKAKDGSKLSSPQAILSDLIGQLSFDPLEFANMKSDKQLLTLQTLVSLDFTDIETSYKRVYDERTVTGRVRDQLKARLEALPHNATAPTAEVLVSEMMKQFEENEQYNATTEQLRHQLKDRINEAGEISATIENLERQISQIKVRREISMQESDALATQIDARPNRDVTELRQQIHNADTTNRAVRENNQRTQLMADVQAKIDEYTIMTVQLDGLALQKKQRLEATKFPVQGLSFSDDGVLFNEIPFEQASSAEQLRVSAAMGLAMNPKLRVLLIRDGSLLDEQNMALLAAMAEEHDAQIWVERVGDGAEVSVVIEDGRVSEDRTGNVPLSRTEEIVPAKKGRKKNLTASSSVEEVAATVGNIAPILKTLDEIEVPESWTDTNTVVEEATSAMESGAEDVIDSVDALIEKYSKGADTEIKPTSDKRVIDETMDYDCPY